MKAGDQPLMNVRECRLVFGWLLVAARAPGLRGDTTPGRL